MPKSPADFLGFAPGDDRKLADWKQITGYFKELCRDARRIKWFDMGTSTEGRPFFYLTISSPENLANLEEYKSIQSRLADPRGLTEEEASALIDEGKAIVLTTCSIHATEVGAAQMSMQLAYNLEVAEDGRTLDILDNVILILVPSLNPDGLDLVVDWYRKYLGTPYEGTSPPFLYQKYAGHDNNRDWFMLNLVETRLTVEHIHNVWHPQIVYDLHQMGDRGFRFFLPPYLDPYDPNVDYILRQEVAELGLHMMGEVLSGGKTGVSCYNGYDAFAPSRAFQHYHGGVRILSEAASVRIATPIVRKKEDLRPTRDGADPREASWNHPAPWPGGEWRLRDIVDYELLACMACLSHASCFRRLWLENFYKIGKRACERKAPYAYIIPARQKDPGLTYELLTVLHKGQVEIHRAEEDFEVNGKLFHKGDYVVKLAQPYGSYAKTLLEIQEYPDLRQYPGGPPKLPYDITGHTLPLLMGVKVYLANSSFEASLEKLEAPEEPKGGVDRVWGVARKDPSEETITWIALSASVNRTAKVVNDLLGEGVEVYRTVVGFSEDGEYISPGTFLVGIDKVEEVDEKARRFGVRGRLLKMARSPLMRLAKPRLGVYKSYRATADEGWLRLVLEEYGFPYREITNHHVRDGASLEELETLIVPSQSAPVIAGGIPRGQYPPEYTGGWEREGRDSIVSFIEDGGTCVFLGNSGEWAIAEMGLPCIDVVAGKPSQEFFAPGSILKTIVDTDHPLGFGLSRETPVMFVRSSAWEVPAGVSGSPGEATVVARYPAKEPLMSGWLLGGHLITNKAALLEVPVGRGRVVLVGFHPHFRAQARATYKFIFNAIYLGGAENV